MVPLHAVEAYVRSYQEPRLRDASSSNPSVGLPLVATADSRSPLPEGTLQSNLGCNIVVVCSKVRSDPQSLSLLDLTLCSNPV